MSVHNDKSSQDIEVQPPKSMGSLPKKIGIAISIIVMLGAIAAGVIGVMGYYQLAPFGHLSSHHSIILMGSGGGGLIGSIVLATCILKIKNEQAEPFKDGLTNTFLSRNSKTDTKMILRGPRLSDQVPGKEWFEAKVSEYHAYLNSDVQKDKEVKFVSPGVVGHAYETMIFLRWLVLTDQINSFCSTGRGQYYVFHQKPDSLPNGCGNPTLYTKELLTTIQEGMEPFQHWKVPEGCEALAEQVYDIHYFNLARPGEKKNDIIILKDIKRIDNDTLNNLLRANIIHAWDREGSVVLVKINETNETVYNKKPEHWTTRGDLRACSKSF